MEYFHEVFQFKHDTEFNIVQLTTYLQRLICVKSYCICPYAAWSYQSTDEVMFISIYVTSRVNSIHVIECHIEYITLHCCDYSWEHDTFSVKWQEVAPLLYCSYISEVGGTHEVVQVISNPTDVQLSISCNGLESLCVQHFISVCSYINHPASMYGHCSLRSLYFDWARHSECAHLYTAHHAVPDLCLD